MSKRNPLIGFGSWTLWDLNPLNYALKNDFIENLIHMASVSCNFVSGFPNAKILKAYEPKSVSPDADGFSKYHHSGSAIALSWDDFSKEEILMNPFTTIFIDSNQNKSISVVVFEDHVILVQDFKGSLYDATSNYRVVHKSNSVM